MSDEPAKCTNYLRIVRLLVDIGTDTARSLFYHFKPKDKVTTFFQSQVICDELTVLKRKNGISREQYLKLVFYPDPNPDEYDLSLLITILINLFKINIAHPKHGWDKPVAEGDTTLGADLLRLRDIRNKVVGHRPNAELSTEDFEKLWELSKVVLIRVTEFIDATKKEEITARIDDYRTSTLDKSTERRYLSLLQTWHEEAMALLSHLKQEVDMLCERADGFVSTFTATMSDDPAKCTNYLRIVRLLVDIGTDTARSLFYHFKPKGKVATFFQSQVICDELTVLKRKNGISREQYLRLVIYPDPNPDEYDLSLLITLLINLFKINIAHPKHGWDKPVAEGDTTLGADLLRLRDIRNKVVGHRPNAELSTEDFEKLWELSKVVLIRVTEFIDATKKEEITARIDDYKTSTLDKSTEIRYLSLLQTWHEEAMALLSHLKQEVDMLCERADGFDIFFKSKIPDRYLRYVSLLYEGGLLVLAGIMKRELDNRRRSLKDLLLSNKPWLLASRPYAENVIFTSDDKVITDISLWGLKPLSDVILLLFRDSFSSMEQRAIEGISTASGNYGNIAFDSLDSDKFRTHWTDVVFNITVLASDLDDDTRLESMMLIRKHDTEDIDKDAAKTYLKHLRQNCEPFQSLVEQYIDLREKLKATVEQMQQEGACFGKDQIIELKMMTFGKTEEKRELAENILYTVWEAAVHNTGGSTDFPAIKTAVEHILNGVKGIDGVTKVEVEKLCIILKLRCTSIPSLSDLLSFLSRPLIHEFTEVASHEFSAWAGEKIVITTFISAESLQTTLKSIGDADPTCTPPSIGIKLSCSSVDTVEQVRNSFQSNETSNSINQIAQSLSDRFGEKISVCTTPEVGGNPHVYSDPLRSISDSEWTEFVLPSDTALPVQEPDFSHVQQLQSVLNEIKSPKQANENLDWFDFVLDYEKRETRTELSESSNTFVLVTSPASHEDDSGIPMKRRKRCPQQVLVDGDEDNQGCTSRHSENVDVLFDNWLGVNQEDILWDGNDTHWTASETGHDSLTVLPYSTTSLEVVVNDHNNFDRDIDANQIRIPDQVRSVVSDRSEVLRRRSEGPVVNWDDYDIPKQNLAHASCSSFGSFASLASHQSINEISNDRRNTIG